MTLRSTLLMASFLASSLALGVTAAQAQPVTGFYVGAGVGANYLQNSDIDLTPAAETALRANGLDTSWKWGPAAAVSAGYGFGNGLRMELEGSFRDNKLKSISGATGTRTGEGGQQESWGLMVNALYDFDIGLPVFPYIGIGGGAVWTEWKDLQVGYSGGTGRSRFATYANIGEPVVTWGAQAIAGLSMPISAVPGLSATLDYRFLATGKESQDGYTIRADRTGRSTVRGGFKSPSYNHTVMVGLRYAFGVAPAPVPVAPPTQPVVAPPALARTYLVFFDFDRADLTDRARQITSEAAQNSKTLQVTRIEVAGHADRSGSPQYNQALSMRRAEAVASELGRLGVSRSEISVQAFGESRPLVPTADGVREPQNRRVEIVLR